MILYRLNLKYTEYYVSKKIVCMVVSLQLYTAQEYFNHKKMELGIWNVNY